MLESPKCQQWCLTGCQCPQHPRVWFWKKKIVWEPGWTIWQQQSKFSWKIRQIKVNSTLSKFHVFLKHFFNFDAYFVYLNYFAISCFQEQTFLWSWESKSFKKTKIVTWVYHAAWKSSQSWNSRSVSLIFVVYLFNVYDAQALTDRTERAKLAVGLKKDAKKLSQNSTRKYIHYFSKYSNSQWTTTH